MSTKCVVTLKQLVPRRSYLEHAVFPVDLLSGRLRGDAAHAEPNAQLQLHDQIPAARVAAAATTTTENMHRDKRYTCYFECIFL